MGQITCYGKKFDDETNVESIEAAWNAEPPYRFCKVTVSGGELSPADLAAVTAVAGKEASQLSQQEQYRYIGYILGFCATTNADSFREATDTGTPKAGLAAMDLCPGHPFREEFIAAFEELKIYQANFVRPISSGTYRIGKKVKPGTYVSSGNNDACYWELTDAQGNIIDNHISNGPRQVVTIPETAYAFYTNGCELWKIDR